MFTCWCHPDFHVKVLLIKISHQILDSEVGSLTTFYFCFVLWIRDDFYHSCMCMLFGFLNRCCSIHTHMLHKYSPYCHIKSLLIKPSHQIRLHERWFLSLFQNSAMFNAWKWLSFYVNICEYVDVFTNVWTRFFFLIMQPYSMNPRIFEDLDVC